ncbi:MAG: hypothetical protein GWN17_05490 [Candidatus Korarchaeota archaeon]|nr:hypothetical protein [Candidatus Thorarchaeota archaeon]NIW51669.1 hypothetical protein [Candidatus Korarchaeota archaeon]
MQKEFGKAYPIYNAVDFHGNRDRFCWRELPTPPSRFGKVYIDRVVENRDGNFIAFGGEIYHRDRQIQDQEEICIYDGEVILSDRNQLGANLQRLDSLRGEIDFFINHKCLSLKDGSLLTLPEDNRRPRYPFRIATYFVVQNILVFPNLLIGEMTPSLHKLISWVFRKTETFSFAIKKRGPILIGSDPEFNVVDLTGNRIRADQFLKTGSQEQVGCDGSSATGELRPTEKCCPLEHAEELRTLMQKLARKVGADTDWKVVTGGGGNIAPIGHHIHFNRSLDKEEVELLDIFVGIPGRSIKGAKRTGGQYESIGREAVRGKPWGAEYRAPASSLIPELATALYVTAYCCLMKWDYLDDQEKFKVDIDDDTQVPTLQSYLALDVTPDKKYSCHLEEYWKWCNGIEGREIDPERDVLHRWVPNRKEIKSVPGFKIIWGSGVESLLSSSRKKIRFLEYEDAGKVISLRVEKTYEEHITAKDESKHQFALQIFAPSSVLPDPSSGKKKALKKMEQLTNIKVKHDISKITISESHDSVGLKLTPTLIKKYKTATKLSELLIDLFPILL